MPHEPSAILSLGAESDEDKTRRLTTKDAKAALKVLLKQNAARLQAAKKEVEAAIQEGVDLRTKLDGL